MKVLNETVKEMDTFEVIGMIRKDNVPYLRMKMYCLNGGEFENISLNLDAEYPDTFHLPFSQGGDFEFVSLSDTDKVRLTYGREYIPSESVGLKVDGRDCGFYITYDAFFWEAEGEPLEVVDNINSTKK